MDKANRKTVLLPRVVGLRQKTTIVIVLLFCVSLATGFPSGAKDTVIIGSETECLNSEFDLFDLKPGSTLAQVENRKDCTFRKQLPGSALTRRPAVLSKDGETCLAAWSPEDAAGVMGGNCSKLHLNGMTPDALFCYFEKESESGPLVLNEIFAGFSNIDPAVPLGSLEEKYGAGKRIILPNHTVEYKWKNTKHVLSLFVMMHGCCIYLQSNAKRKKYEEIGGLLPGFSIESAKQLEEQGRSFMAESEKKKNLEFNSPKK